MSQNPCDLILSLRSNSFFIALLHDPRTLPTYSPKGALAIQAGNNGGKLFQKQDDGTSTNWELINPNPLSSSIIIQETHTITESEEMSKKFTLSLKPDNGSDFFCTIVGGTAQIYNIDYTIIEQDFLWEGFQLDGLLTKLDTVIVRYKFTPT